MENPQEHTKTILDKPERDRDQQPQLNTTRPLILAIFSTVLCCAPLGAVGILFAALAANKLRAGDENGAREAAGKARIFSFAAIVLGAVSIVVYTLLFLIGQAAQGN